MPVEHGPSSGDSDATRSLDGLSHPQNVLVISLDCVRPEALSCYAERFRLHESFPYLPRTPNIDRVAGDAVRFTECFCQAPFTPASHGSLFTGLNPYRHGIREIFGYQLYDEVTTTAELLSEVGLSTGSFIGAHALNSQYGFARGFDRYDETFENGQRNWVLGERRDCREVTDRALEWLDTQDSGWFLFAHYFDAHDGGQLPTRTRNALSATRQRLDRLDPRPGYAADLALETLGVELDYGHRYYIRQMNRIDRQLGRLFSRLRDNGSYDETLIVICADHGDAFGEHGEYNHREFLYDTTLQVPLIVKCPGASITGTHTGQVRLIDVHPTVCDFMGIDAGDIDGRSLVDDLTTGADRDAYAETRVEASTDDTDSLERSFVGLRTPRWKLIRDCLTDQSELYDLSRDPDERTNVADEDPDKVAELNAAIDERHKRIPPDADNRMSAADSETITDRLRGLGYLE